MLIIANLAKVYEKNLGLPSRVTKHYRENLQDSRLKYVLESSPYNFEDKHLF